MNVRGKSFIVTGGANGIGKAIVKRLIQEEAITGVLDIDEAALLELKEEVSEVFCIKCDLTKINQVENAVGTFLNTSGSIDVLINCAGIIQNSPLISFGMGGLRKHDIQLWDNVISTNLNSVFYVTVTVVEQMIQKRNKGLIINISSICAGGNAGQSAYSAAKAGVNALTVVWAKELGGWGIRVAGLAPGFTNTKTTINSVQESVLEEWKEKTPLRRIGTPDEIVNGIFFIIGNDFYHGRVLEIDGGLRI